MSSLNRIVKENLSKWDELAPLKESQVKSILLLSQSANQFSEVDALETESSLRELELLPTNELSITREEDERLGRTNNTANKNKPEERDLNEDINDLLYNFDVNDIEDARIEKYVNHLNKNSYKCNQISDMIGDALSNLKVLIDNYDQVSQKTKSLHVACEQLLSDQVSKLLYLSLSLSFSLESLFPDLF
jgi:hypothetical protein